MSERERISTTTNTALIRCPFFIGHGKMDILCEGMIDGTRLRCSFDNPDAKEWHQHNYCEHMFERCEICASIRHWKWPEDE